MFLILVEKGVSDRTLVILAEEVADAGLHLDRVIIKMKISLTHYFLYLWIDCLHGSHITLLLHPLFLPLHFLKPNTIIRRILEGVIDINLEK